MPYKDHAIALGAVSYWRLGEPSGTTCNDENGTNDGTYVNTPTLGATGALNPHDTDTAVTFASASTEYADCGAGASLAPTNYTLELLIKPGTISANSVMAGRYADGSTDGYMVAIDGTTGYLYCYHKGGGAFNNITGSADLRSASAWHHVALTFDTTNGNELWLDGVSQGTDSTTTTAASPGATKFFIGAQDHTNKRPYNGSLDEVAFYNFVLTDDEIAQRYAMFLGSDWVTADGGGLGGGAATILWVPSINIVTEAMDGGALGGGALAYFTRVAAATSGGGISGGTAAVNRLTAWLASGGSIAGGAALGVFDLVRRQTQSAIGGGVIGGAASIAFIKSLLHTASGGAIAGGTGLIGRRAVLSSSAGAVAGGSATSWSDTDPVAATTPAPRVFRARRRQFVFEASRRAI